MLKGSPIPYSAMLQKHDDDGCLFDLNLKGGSMCWQSRKGRHRCNSFSGQIKERDKFCIVDLHIWDFPSIDFRVYSRKDPHILTFSN